MKSREILPVKRSQKLPVRLLIAAGCAADTEYSASPLCKGTQFLYFL